MQKEILGLPDKLAQLVQLEPKEPLVQKEILVPQEPRELQGKTEPQVQLVIKVREVIQEQLVPREPPEKRVLQAQLGIKVREEIQEPQV